MTLEQALEELALFTADTGIKISGSIEIKPLDTSDETAEGWYSCNPDGTDLKWEQE